MYNGIIMYIGLTSIFLKKYNQLLVKKIICSNIGPVVNADGYFTGLFTIGDYADKEPERNIRNDVDRI